VRLVRLGEVRSLRVVAKQRGERIVLRERLPSRILRREVALRRGSFERVE
jgi:hypothetical protein